MRSRSLEFPVGGMTMPPPQPKREVTVLHYRIGKTLGEGTYGKVKLGLDTKSNQKVCASSSCCS